MLDSLMAEWSESVLPQGLELDNRGISDDQEIEQDGWDQVFPG